MRALLLAVASLAVALPAPADGQAVSDVRFSARSGGSSHHGGFGRHDRRRHRDDGVFVYDYYREYQGDTLWRENSFNDWWHDRPDRAYPRWMANNQNCERKWWAGSELRC